MPYKFNQGRRHKIPKAKYRVTNWPEYDAALVRRGNLTVWVAEEAVGHGMLRRPAGAAVNRSIPIWRSRRGWRFDWSSISRFARPRVRYDRSQTCLVLRSEFRTMRLSAGATAA